MRPRTFSSRSVVGQERCQQALSGRAEFVIDPEVKASLFDQTGIEQDAQVTADAGLLALNDQADIADAQLPSFAQELEHDQARAVAQSLGLASAMGRFGRLQQMAAQAF